MNTDRKTLEEHLLSSRPPAATEPYLIPTWALLLASGVILGLAYPPNPVALFGSVGLVPLLYALDRAKSARQVFSWSYFSLLIFSALTSWWIGSWQAKTDTFLMISCVLLILLHPLFFVLPLLFYHGIRRARGTIQALIFLPFIWCGGEYLHALSDASYPWLTLGNTQTYNLYYIQFIEFTGVWGLSFLLLVQSVTLAAMLLYPQRRMMKLGLAIIAITLVPPYLYGFHVLGNAADESVFDRLPERAITVTAVQPNEDPWEKWKALDTVDHVRLNMELAQKSLADAGGVRPDMFLWAENAIPYTMTQPGGEGRRDAFYQAVDRLGIPVMTGFPDYLRYKDPAQAPISAKKEVEVNPTTGALDTFRYDHFNSVGLFVPGRGLTGAYHKMQLVPFGERIPFADDVPFLISLLSWDVGISSWAKGTDVALFDVPTRNGTVKGGSVICIESIYPNVVRRFTERGAEFLTIITNDGWYLGTPGPLQHERFATLRAIENRRSIARAANTGISCMVTPYGSIFAETPEGIATTTTGRIEVRSDMTLYVLWGDWWPQLCLAVAAALGGWAAAAGMRRGGEGERG
jgi:apolipoprotein N-acyltransferase